MPFDVVVYYESQAAAALTPFAAIADRYYTVSGDDIRVKETAPFLAGIAYLAVSTPKYVELRQPSLRVPYRSYRSGLIGTVNDLPASFLNLFQTPLPLYPTEKLNAYAQNASTEVNLIAVFLSNGSAPQSAIEAAAPTHLITGYADSTLTAGIWNDVTITWDQDLQAGRYAVVGMQVASYIASGYASGVARLNILDTNWKIGCLIGQATGDKTIVAAPDMGLMGMSQRYPLMREISFKHDQMPNLQMVSSAALTDHVINLLLQKIE